MILDKMMNTLLRITVALLGVFFVISGLRWLFEPNNVAEALGMLLLNGLGRSTQVGDFAAFFLTLGTCVLLGLMTSKRTWYYPSIMLLGFAAAGRLIAWLVHDAALATNLIVFEMVVAALFMFASRRLAKA